MTDSEENHDRHSVEDQKHFAKNAASAEAPPKPSKPVRMRWGKIVEESPEAPKAVSADDREAEGEAEKKHHSVSEDGAPAKEVPNAPERPQENEEKKSDPRIEALRRRLKKREAEVLAEQRQAKAVQNRTAFRDGAKNETARAAQNDRTARKKSAEHKTSNAQRVSVSKPITEEALIASRIYSESYARAAEAERRRLEAESARHRAEIEEAELRHRLRKHRRRETALDVFGAIFGALFSLIRSIRISKKAVLAIAVTLLCSCLLAVILGNVLKGIVGTGTPEDTGAESDYEAQEGTEDPPHNSRNVTVSELNAGVVSLVGATEKSLRSEAERFLAAGMTSVSLLLRDGDGNLLFRAKTDEALGIEDKTGETDRELLSLEEICKPFLVRDIYVSCILPVRYFSDGDEYSQSVLYAYETALLCEIAEAGADEVILLDGDALLLSALQTETEAENAVSEAISELSAMARAVNERVPELPVGIALSPAFLATRESDVRLSELVSAFDFSLLDLRSAEKESDLYSAVSSGVSEHLYFILRYKMRVLIPAGSAEAVSREEIKNWQEGTLPSISEEETVS